MQLVMWHRCFKCPTDGNGGGELDLQQYSVKTTDELWMNYYEEDDKDGMGLSQICEEKLEGFELCARGRGILDGS